MSNKVPDRWLDYSPFGDVIKGTRILPLKVPLKSLICSQVPADQRFTPFDFLDKMAENNFQLGLIVDLTATKRYYNPEDFLERDVQYVKIFTRGHAVPSSQIVRDFTSTLSSFEEDNRENDLIIGVHCTHGVNRTGYLISRYLIENKGFKPEDAIQAFKEARGHHIERQNYIESLQGLKSKVTRSPQRDIHIPQQRQRTRENWRTRWSNVDEGARDIPRRHPDQHWNAPPSMSGGAHQHWNAPPSMSGGAHQHWNAPPSRSGGAHQHNSYASWRRANQSDPMRSREESWRSHRGRHFDGYRGGRGGGKGRGRGGRGGGEGRGGGGRRGDRGRTDAGQRTRWDHGVQHQQWGSTGYDRNYGQNDTYHYNRQAYDGGYQQNWGSHISH